MDIRRRQKHSAERPDMMISNSSLPGFSLLTLSLILIIIGAILMAAFGIPNEEFPASVYPERTGGPVVMAVGVAVGIAAIVLSVHLKNKGNVPAVIESNEASTAVLTVANHTIECTVTNG